MATEWLTAVPPRCVAGAHFFLNGAAMCQCGERTATQIFAAPLSMEGTTAEEVVPLAAYSRLNALLVATEARVSSLEIALEKARRAGYEAALRDVARGVAEMEADNA